MISFLCPQCIVRLNVLIELAGIVGPCPVCAQLIKAPRGQSKSAVSRQVNDTTSQTCLPNIAQERGANENERISRREIIRSGSGSSVLVNHGAGFSAVNKIEAIKTDGLDDSWKEKVARERKQLRMRRRRDRWLESLVMSPRARKLQKISIIVITAIPVLTMGALYMNYRSGGALFKRLFG